MFRFDLSDSNELAGDIQIVFLSKTKDVLFSLTFNTFCSFTMLENDEYSLDDSSCLGRKTTINSGEVVWTLTKSHIDGDKSNKHLDSSAKVYTFKYVTDKDFQLLLINQTKYNHDNNYYILIDKKYLKINLIEKLNCLKKLVIELHYDKNYGYEFD